MRTHTEPAHLTSPPQPHAGRLSPDEPVDLDDLTAVKRAIALHQAGRAVFAIPFNSPGPGTLTWLDPSRR